MINFGIKIIKNKIAISKHNINNIILKLICNSDYYLVY